MVRGLMAAWLLVALAPWLPLRADDLNPLRAASSQLSSVRVVTHNDDAEVLAPIVDGSPPRLLEEPGILDEALRPPEKSWPGVAVEPDHVLGPEMVDVDSELSWYQCWLRACSPHRDPNDPQRHVGFGEPLLNTSWRNRPLYLNFFAGGLIGDELEPGVISQGGGFIGGGRFGGDFDHYWGLETRLAFSNLNTEYISGESGQSFVSFFDASLLYHPWGDARWRPYLTLGLGMANYRYDSPTGARLSNSAMTLPWGIGMKYLLRPDVAVRFDLIDNFSFAGGTGSTMLHNVSFTGGLELRFGGRRTSYGSW